MYQKILLCADGSKQALSAAHLAADLACRLKAKIDLVHVLDPFIAAGPSGMVPEAGLSSQIALQCAEEGQQAILRCTGQILAQANVPYQAFAEYGHPVHRIHEIAVQEQADLIVIGSRGLSAWPALMLGSVSEGVARHASCPVLIVRGEPNGFHQIVIASDGSEGAAHAVRSGIEMAKDYHAHVSVLNVFQNLTLYPGVSTDNLDPEVYFARVEQAITSQIEPIARQAGVPFRFSQEVGHPAETLLHFAEKQHADLIVVGSRGLGGFKRLLLGSVSTSVIHHAHCSILVTR